ncbi:piggyBac transposable element-derived protein 3-like [Palaemon carinicauda]|uniref:piggyBac transposable element-derived protein 3-like n=1 Tax=Palaemon carinicauda TaxID=392227 RepID=UPI0035B64988
MIEYFGKHRCKQCITGKPIRIGHRAWCLNTDDGYLKLQDRKYGGTETVRENRCKGCPVMPVQQTKKQKRGSSEYFVDKENKIVVCRWMDNSALTIASTIHKNDSSCKVKRYCQKEKKKIEVDCPKIIQEYNRHMRGTDKQDQNVNKHRISFRGKN